MTPAPSSSQKPLKPILKRSPSNSASKSVTFSATNSQVFFADDWDRSAVEVVSKLSYRYVSYCPLRVASSLILIDCSQRCA